MPYRTSEDLWPPLGLLVLGMVAPGLAVLVAGDLLALYLSMTDLTLLVAAGYGLLAWVAIDRAWIDDTSYLLVSLIFPWPLVVGVLFVVVLLNQGEAIPRGPLADVFRALTTDWPGSMFGYAAVFAGAGVGSVLLSRGYRRRADRDDRLPSATGLVSGMVAILVVLGVGLAGANAIATAGATVDHVGPGTAHFRDPALNVTVAGPTAELRVTAMAPDGTRVTTRLPRAAMRGGAGTVAIPIDYDGAVGPDELPVRDGRYRVQVTSLAGLPVATATFDAGDAAAASLSGVATANGTLPWASPPPVKYGRGAGDTRLGLAVTNDGAFHAEMSLTVQLPDDDIVVDRVFLAPGERAGVVIGLDPASVRAVRDRADGRVRIELYVSATADEPETAVEVVLPPAST